VVLKKAIILQVEVGKCRYAKCLPGNEQGRDRRWGDLREVHTSTTEKNLPVFLAIYLPISIIVSLQRLA